MGFAMRGALAVIVLIVMVVVMISVMVVVGMILPNSHYNLRGRLRCRCD
jgi:hypothetical protein